MNDVALENSSFTPLQLMLEIVQHCLHPRMLLTPMDAEYCARMIKLLHKVATPAFSTASCYDQVLGDQVSAIISSTSTREVQNYGALAPLFLYPIERLKRIASLGRFLRLVLQDLDGLYASEDAYKSFNKQANQPSTVYLPGFIKNTRRLGRSFIVTEEDILSHFDLRLFIVKLHKKLLKV